MFATSAPRNRLRALLLAALVASGAGVLSGCAPEPGLAGPTDGPSATTTPSGTLPPTEQPDLGEPGPECGEVLTAEDVYAFNPNMSAVAAPAPVEGSLAAEAASLDGTVCRWSNNTSNVSVDVAVAVPGESDLADRRSAAESGATRVHAFGDAPVEEGYFDVEGSVGTAQVFENGRWIVLSSPMFGEAADVEPLVTAILANLGAAS
jgi:hypothetical protein